MYRLKIAEEQDYSKLAEFISYVKVDWDRFKEICEAFIILQDKDDKVVASVGLEIVENNGLVRLLIVTPEIGQAYALSLIEGIEQLKAKYKLEKLFVKASTEPAEELFGLIGYYKMEKGDIPEKVAEKMKDLSEETVIMAK
ncbi:hypothetical protein LC087_12385 [Bacillus carboniphilus]|uniref:N-acetyltransferase domain-containing protein n=1 Tax=Bacillus carboniphilus TaxID=86663 RepID=A0ABY9JQI3_9BACI|nr:hypothetical protein [Bacillus carboniphilus]WLR41662.1 hypothetical protein LC087_12385 [Bacillus carboniphilus]